MGEEGSGVGGDAGAGKGSGRRAERGAGTVAARGIHSSASVLRGFWSLIGKTMVVGREQSEADELGVF